MSTAARDSRLLRQLHICGAHGSDASDAVADALQTWLLAARMAMMRAQAQTPADPRARGQLREGRADVRTGLRWLRYHAPVPPVSRV